mgnify:CR=1 FL=1
MRREIPPARPAAGMTLPVKLLFTAIAAVLAGVGISFLPDGLVEEAVSIPTSDGFAMPGFVARPAGKKKAPVIVVMRHTACEYAAARISQGVLNIFDCWANPDLFDARLDFAVREWARRSDQVRAEVARADAERQQQLAVIQEERDNRMALSALLLAVSDALAARFVRRRAVSPGAPNPPEI